MIPLHLKETDEAIKCLKTNKSPGSQSSVNSLVKTAPFLLNINKNSTDKSFLPPTLCQGPITLIHLFSLQILYPQNASSPTTNQFFLKEFKMYLNTISKIKVNKKASRTTLISK